VGALRASKFAPGEFVVAALLATTSLFKLRGGVFHDDVGANEDFFIA
jgi:hypothetical protein